MARRTKNRVRRPVVGVYRSATDARHAMVALEQAGINGGRLEVVGRQGEAGAAPPPAAADRKLMGHVAAPIRRGALVGAAVGAAVGLAFGVAISVQAGDALWEPQLWAPPLAGIFPGAVIGALMAFRLSVAMSPAWSRTFAEVEPGRACVAVGVTSAEEEESAAELLSGTDPEKVLVGTSSGEVRRIC